MGNKNDKDASLQIKYTSTIYMKCAAMLATQRNISLDFAKQRIVILVTNVDMLENQHRDKQVIVINFVHCNVPKNQIICSGKKCNWNFTALEKQDLELFNAVYQDVTTT